MLLAYCQAKADEKTINIDSLQIHYQIDSIPRTINGSMVIDSNKAVGDTVIVMVRIYCDNSLMINNLSPDNYSFIEKIAIKNGHQNCELIPWEISNDLQGMSYIRYEIWDENNHYLRSVEIKE